MNYRHAYHAGNHADVLKHIVLALVIQHLKKKEKPFLYLDAHAGAGLYALESAEAEKTGEWRHGVARVWDTPFAEHPLLKPWRDAVAALNPAGALRVYPGSPEIARAMLRGGDRLLLGELHPQEHALLAARFATDPRASVVAEDAATTLKARLPPPERRAVILIDPPYESNGEPSRALRMLAQGLKRFATGQFLLWYPVTGDGVDERIKLGVEALARGRTLIAEVRVREPRPLGGLAGSGLAAVNPPWGLAEELGLLLPELAARLSTGEGRHILIAPPVK